jgi:hypothetical protein
MLVSSSRNITHEGALKDTNEGNDLNKASSGDGVGAEKGGNAIRERIERITSVVDASWKVDSSTGHDLAEEGKLGDTAVLDLDVTEAVEALLGAVTAEHSEGIEEPKGGLGAELVLERAELSGGLAGLGRGERGGRANEGGEGSNFHHG